MDNSWLKERGRSMHMTIRDVDCQDFDVDAFVQGLKELNVTFYSFFAGGYVSTYPTKLEDQRISPYLNGHDLMGELVEKSHAAGIKVVAMIDLAQLTPDAARRHPDWCARNAQGEPIRVEDRIFATCPNSAFRREYCVEMFKEILENYDIDCVKLGGGSFGFSNEICYCDRCRESYRAFSGAELPEKRDWKDPNFRKFYAWQLKTTREMIAYVRDTVNAIKPGMPLMGNATAFGDPGWILKCGLDMEELAVTQDAVQVETQARERAADEGETVWQSLTWPAETANYMTHITDRPIWDVSSYFLAWPWRRSAMSYAEQKVYFAQKIAFGAIPMVNTSGGPMKVHEDQRGWKAIREIYGYMADHQQYYDGDESYARIAVLVSQETLVFYGNDKAADRYVKHIRGVEQMLQEKQIPFDLLSIRTFRSAMDYDLVILPNMACMSDAEGEKIRAFVKAGGRLIATYNTSLYDEKGNRREDFLLRDLFKANYVRDAHVEHDHGDEIGVQMAYMVLDEAQKNKGWFSGLGDTTLLPAFGHYAKVMLTNKAVQVPLVKSPSMQVFPEGLAYPLSAGENWPMMTVPGENVIYFPCEIDKAYTVTCYETIRDLFLNAVRHLEKRPRPVLAENAYKTVLISSRVQKAENRRNIHLINLTGGGRCFDELIPLHGIRVGVPAEGKTEAVLVSTGENLPVTEKDGYVWAEVSCLKDYDIVSFRKIG